MASKVRGNKFDGKEHAAAAPDHDQIQADKRRDEQIAGGWAERTQALAGNNPGKHQSAHERTRGAAHRQVMTFIRNGY